jgi:Electron transfer DM13
MPLLDRALAILPRSRRKVPSWARLAAVPAVVVVVAFGVWVTGAVLTQDATLAMMLTGLWFALAGAAALAVGVRWRPLALPVIAGYAVTTLLLGGYLGYTSTVDRVVGEEVTMATTGMTGAAPGPAGGRGPAAAPARTAVTILAEGEFVGDAHDTTGTAQVLARPDGTRVLTLTDFATDPGPDLRVYLVPGDGSDVDGAVDVGALKGNVGNQQYDVPAETDAGAVVIWCRAFSVSFGTAVLA